MGVVKLIHEQGIAPMDYKPAQCSKSASLRLFLASILLVLLMVVPLTQAQAQVTGMAGATSSSQSEQSPKDQSVSLDKLADMLENDKTRQQLIKELRQAAESDQDKTNKPDAVDADADKAVAQPKSPSFAHRLAETTAQWSEAIGNAFSQAWERLATLTEKNSDGSNKINWDSFLASTLVFFSVVAATIIPLLVLRILAGWLFSVFAKLPGKARAKGLSRRNQLWSRVVATASSILVDAAVVFIAGSIGYAIGLYAVGEHGAMGTRESLFINAFVMIELLKVAVRALFADNYDDLRILPITPEVAGWWSLRIRWFIGVIGYVLLVAVPIVNQELNYFVGAALNFLVMGAAYIYALYVIFSNRRLMKSRLLAMADKSTLSFFSVLYRLFARIWVILALAYFTTLFVVSQFYPREVLPGMVRATLLTVVLAVICFALSGMVSRLIGHRFRFNDSLREALPTLEVRLNSYIPNALKIVRFVILVLFLAIALNIWGIFNFNYWLGTPAGIQLINTLVHVALVLAGAAAVWVIVASLLEHAMTPNSRRAPTARQQTLLTLFRNAFAIILVGFTIMITLSQIGVDIGPLIAGAGVFGLAIGFGAQRLVQDIITGIFIQLENAINAGDYVSLAGTEGTAERLTIRSVSLRDIDGVYHIVPFSSAGVVSNYQRFWAYFRTEYRVAYREDIDTAVYHLREAFEELKQDPDQKDNILEDMTIPGVTEIDENAIKIRIMIKTKAGMQWSVGRALNRLVKIHFDQASIEIPYENRRLWFGENHAGEAPSAKIRMVSGEEDEERLPDYEKKKRRRSDDEAPEETGDAP